MAENNHQRTLALRAPRGVLFDRNGKVLVDNPQFLHYLDRPRAHQGSRSHGEDAVGVAGLDPKQVKQIVDRNRGEPIYRPIVVVEDASLAQVAAITARRLDFELPDVRVEQVPTRKYPRCPGRASVRLVGEASDAQVGDGVIAGRHHRPAGDREGLQPAADG